MEKGRHCASNFKKIIFYSSKDNKALLEVELTRAKPKAKTKNLFGNIVLNDAIIQYLYLHKEPVNARKINLKRDDNYIITKNNDLGFSESELYINADIEGVEIIEEAESTNEIKKGEHYIYKNYIIKNLKVNYKILNKIFITKEEVEAKDLRTREIEHVEIIEDKINFTKEHYNTKKGDEIIKRYKEKQREGYYATKYIYTYETANELFTSVFDRIEETEERKLYNKNYENLKNKYNINVYGETYGAGLLFKDLKIDLFKIDIEKYINDLKEGAKN